MSRPSKRLTIATVAAATVLAGVCAGLAIASAVDGTPNLTGDSTVTPVAYTRTLGFAPDVPGAASPAAIVNDVLQRPGIVGQVQAALSAPPDATRAGRWLDFTVPTGYGRVAGVLPAWKADLVQDVVAEAFAARGLPSVVGSTITGTFPSGQSVELGGGMGDVEAGQQFSSESDATVEAHIRFVLASVNLTPASIEIVRAGQPAPAVVATTSDPRSAVAAAADTIRSLFGQNPPLYEGYYLRVQDASGATVFVASASFRTGSGRLWVDPSVEPYSSLVHG